MTKKVILNFIITTLVTQGCQTVANENNVVALEEPFQEKTFEINLMNQLLKTNAKVITHR